jgi:hypothetical protein
MRKEEDAMTTKSESGGWPSFLAQMPENWLENCKTLQTTSQAIAERWLASRSEQAQKNFDAFGQMAACKSPAEFAEVHQRWMKDTVERLTAEVQDYQERVTALSQAATSPEGRPGPRPQPKAA